MIFLLDFVIPAGMCFIAWMLYLVWKWHVIGLVDWSAFVCFLTCAELFCKHSGNWTRKNDVLFEVNIYKIALLVMCKCYLPWSHILGSTKLIHIILWVFRNIHGIMVLITVVTDWKVWTAFIPLYVVPIMTTILFINTFDTATYFG